MRTMTIKISEDLAFKLESMVHEKEAKNKSSIVRKALELYFSKKKSGTTVEKGSFLTLTKGLCGSISGPQDLSDHKNKMEGYGE